MNCNSKFHKKKTKELENCWKKTKGIEGLEGKAQSLKNSSLILEKISIDSGNTRLILTNNRKRKRNNYQGSSKNSNHCLHDSKNSNGSRRCPLVPKNPTISTRHLSSIVVVGHRDWSMMVKIMKGIMHL